MTDKTEAQPEALYVAEQLDATRHAFGDDNAQSKRRASAELRRQQAEIQQLNAQLSEHKAACMAYASEFPPDADGEADVGNVHANIRALKAQLVAQTNRAAAAEQQVAALTQRLDMVNRLNTDAREQLAQLSARQAAPEGWRLVPVDFVRGFGNLAHNYSLQAIAPDYYWGNERSAFTDAYARCGHDLAELKALLSTAPPQPEREPLTELQKQALAVYLPPFQFSHGYVFDSAGLMVADEGRERELDQLASTVGVRIRGWGHLGKLKNGAEVQDTIGELAAEALNAFWKQHGIGAANG